MCNVGRLIVTSEDRTSRGMLRNNSNTIFLKQVEILTQNILKLFKYFAFHTNSRHFQTRFYSPLCFRYENLISFYRF